MVNTTKTDTEYIDVNTITVSRQNYPSYSVNQGFKIVTNQTTKNLKQNTNSNQPMNQQVTNTPLN